VGKSTGGARNAERHSFGACHIRRRTTTASNARRDRCQCAGDLGYRDVILSPDPDVNWDRDEESCFRFARAQVSEWTSQSASAEGALPLAPLVGPLQNGGEMLRCAQHDNALRSA
jgi:hypothetical protein